MEIINLYIIAEFERIKKELKQRGHITNISLSEDDQVFSHLIVVYNATKNIIG